MVAEEEMAVSSVDGAVVSRVTVGELGVVVTMMGDFSAISFGDLPLDSMDSDRTILE